MRAFAALMTIAACALLAAVATARAAEPMPEAGVFAKPNLVAWCIVPYDTKKRTPHERAEMLERLGIRRFAYDWRAEHVASFEEEIIQIKKHGIEYFAFMQFHPDIVSLVEKYRITPQFWLIKFDYKGDTDEEKLESAIKELAPLADQTRQMGCTMALYNHGRWAGEPANMVAIVKRLRENGKNDHVGIVYNLHHGHHHIKDFPQVLALMQPYLVCLNVNGMNDNAKPKILPLGSGQHELAMMQEIKRSGYAGPIGILGHRPADAEVSLRENLEGMKKLLEQMGDEAALATYE